MTDISGAPIQNLAEGPEADVQPANLSETYFRLSLVFIRSTTFRRRGLSLFRCERPFHCIKRKESKIIQ